MTPARRAFALPTALMLGVVVIVLIAAMLQRQAAHAMLGQRQLASYTEHHLARGFNDAVEAWMQSNATRSVADALAPDGHAFDLTTESGQRVGVWVRPGQGRLLVELGGLTSTAADDLRVAGALLRRFARPDELPILIRRDGPVPVDARVAPEPVLRAVAQAVLGNDSDRLADELLAARRSKDLEPADLAQVLASVQMEPDQQARLAAILTAEGGLWEYGVEEIPSGPVTGRDTIAYGGLVEQISTAAVNRADRDAMIQRNSRVLDWWKAEPAQRWWRAENR